VTTVDRRPLMTDDLGGFDIEPEDSWDAGDTVDDLVANLVRRAELLDERRTLIPTGNPVVILEAIDDLVRVARLRRLAGRDLVRADQIDEDIRFVRRRL
jgi:hypothetical protein